MPSGLVTLAPGIVRVPTAGDFLNSFIFLEDDGSVTLVDCGLARAPSRLIAALASLGRHPSEVRRIVLTHAHADHAGGAAVMLERCGLGGVDAHPADRPYLEGGAEPPLGLPDGIARVARLVVRGRFTPVALAGELADGDVLPVAGGLRVVHTPGHTPGHVSLLHEPSGVLVTGDCILNPLSRMQWAYAPFCVSPAQNRASAARFADLDFAIAAFTHGPEVREGARERIRGFLGRSGLP